MKQTFYYGGTILTMDEKRCVEAVLTSEGRILAVGTYEEVEAAAGKKAETEKISLEGRTMMPAFIDAHSHFSAYANAMLQADLEKADILLRATSYISGDFWESKSSPVISCSWMYAYPVITGKVNHITTGHYHGLKRRGAYPAGLEMIAIPFQKLDEVVTALGEMPWTAIAFRGDEESKKELRARMDRWQEMAEELGSTVDLH